MSCGCEISDILVYCGTNTAYKALKTSKIKPDEMFFQAGSQIQKELKELSVSFLLTS